MNGRVVFLSGVSLLLIAGLFIAGCSSRDKPPVAAAKPGSHDEAEHGHAKGVQPLGDYHARIVVEQGGTLRLLILAKDETRVSSIQNQEIQGTLRGVDDVERLMIVLKADPQPDDASGKSSQFVGTVPESLRGKALLADLRILIDNEAYRKEFASATASGHADVGHAAPPSSAAEKAARDLFLTAGGVYTAADIQANGNQTPGEKFKGMQFHMFEDEEAALKAGEKVCPVTSNRSDPKCSWIVNGKKYEFCCPPCLNKFVALAKKQPEKIKAPEAYVHKE